MELMISLSRLSADGFAALPARKKKEYLERYPNSRYAKRKQPIKRGIRKPESRIKPRYNKEQADKLKELRLKLKTALTILKNLEEKAKTSTNPARSERIVSLSAKSRRIINTIRKQIAAIKKAAKPKIKKSGAR